MNNLIVKLDLDSSTCYKSTSRELASKIYLLFILVCCVHSYLLPFFYCLRLRFSLPSIKITARMDRPQTQRNWQTPRIEIHQSPHMHWLQFDHHVFKRSGLLQWLLAAKCRTRNRLFGFALQNLPALDS